MQPSTLGKYELRGVLGRGADGTVYEGWDPAIARHVAIKTIKLPEANDAETEDQLARFRREAQAAGRLTHPNIVAVYDFGETPELAYLVMEFVEGDSLKTVLDRNERMPVAQILQLMQQLLNGLQYSHERGVVHRDIKPSNLMLTKNGALKITDFGIARIEGSSATQVGTVLGTPAYMSPEQWQGVPVDARADIYSAGVLLYHLLTGERPFEGGSTSAIMHKALHTEPVAPSQLSVGALPALDPIVLKAMAKRPEDRYASAAAFAGALRGISMSAREDADRTVVASPKRPAAEPARAIAPNVAAGGKRSTTPALLALVVLLLAAGAGSYWYFVVRLPPVPATTASAPQSPVASVPAAPLPSQPVPSPGAAPPAGGQSVSQEASLPPPPAVPATPAPEPTTAQPAPASPPIAAASPPQTSVPPTEAPPPPPAPGPQASLVSPPIATVAVGRLPAALRHFCEPDMPRPMTSAHEHPQVFCTALDALRAANVTSGFQLKLVQPHAESALHDGDLVRVQAVMPDFDAWLTVDYISSDGGLAHMLPRSAGDQAYPPQRLAAQVRRTLFEPAGAFKGWVAGEPYGTDMIIAVASSEKLPLVARTDDEQQADDYLRTLREAIAAARKRGVAVAATAILVNTLPKQ